MNKYIIFLNICLFTILISCGEKQKEIKTNQEKTDNIEIRKFNDSLNLFLGFYKGMTEKEVKNIHQQNISNELLKNEQYFDNSTNTTKKRSVFIIANQNVEFKSDLSYPTSFYFENKELKFITLGIKSNKPNKELQINELKQKIESNKRKLNQLLNIYSKKYGDFEKIDASMTNALLNVAINKIEKSQQESIKKITQEFKYIYRFKKDNKAVQIYLASPELSKFEFNIGYSLSSELDKLEQEEVNTKNRNIKLTDEKI